jgi:N-acetylneuraminic acid mutarotase
VISDLLYRSIRLELIFQVNHTWVERSASGTIPAARFGHTMSRIQRGRNLVLFGGVMKGEDGKGVLTNDLHILDTGIMRWTCIQAQGSPPYPRHSHATAVVSTRLFVFGGAIDDAGVACNDLHMFDSTTSTWSQPKSKGDPPPPRYGHSMVAVGTRLFLFGGCYGTSTLYSDLYVYDTGT